MGTIKLITEELAPHFPFLCQNLILNMTDGDNPIKMPEMESSIPAIQNNKSRISNFYKCISRL